MIKTTTKVAGVDTGKFRLDVAIAGGDAVSSFDNTPEGHRGLAAWLGRRGVVRVGIEASGGYERGPVEALRAKGFTVIVLQPVQVRAYARFRRQWAKNDRLDAALIAACAAVTEPRDPRDPRVAAWSETLTFLEQIEEDLARAKTRREAFREPELRAALDEEIARLKTVRRGLIARIEAGLRKGEALARRLELLLSIPGIGLRTALALLVHLPELGSLSREAIAALAGLAPFDDDSGTRSGRRHIRGGRGRPRRAIYNAALSAAYHWNPQLKAFYSRLRATGKAHKPALVATARKLLIYANTVLARGTPWEAQPIAD